MRALSQQQRTYAERIPLQVQCLVYGYMRRSDYHIPDDLQRICLLFFFSIDERFECNEAQQVLQFTNKKKAVRAPQRPSFGSYQIADRTVDHLLCGAVKIEPYLNKKYFWKFKVNHHWERLKIGVLVHRRKDMNQQQLYSQTLKSYPAFYAYCSSGHKQSHLTASHGEEFGLSYACSLGSDEVMMEVDFSAGGSALGLLSFGRGIQLLRPAFQLDRTVEYSMFVEMRSKLWTEDATLELLHYNEYYWTHMHRVSPWQKVCAHCQRQNVTKRCSRCKKAYYCNAECQRKHWRSVHVKECKKLLSDD